MVENEVATFTFDGMTHTETIPIAMKVSPAGIRTAKSWAAFAIRRFVIPAACPGHGSGIEFGVG
jgi:hypothetical protein